MNTWEFKFRLPDGRLMRKRISHLTQPYAQAELRLTFPDCEVVSWRYVRRFANESV